MSLNSLISRARLRFLEKRDPVRAARLRGVTLGRDCRLIGHVSFGSEPYLITLGNHVSVTAASFITHDGAIWVARDEHPEMDIIAPIRVGNNVFIGSQAVILPGVTIGDNAIVAAMALVNRDVPSDTVVAGVPAKPIRSTAEYIEKAIRSAIPTKRMQSNEKKRFLLERFRDETTWPGPSSLPPTPSQER